MSFFNTLGGAVARFMYGRNGMDQLNRALLWAYLLLYLVRAVVFATILQSKLLVTAGDVLVFALAVVVLFRMFSKNLHKRRLENQRWVNWWHAFKSRQAGARARHADKEHKYFTCKSCKAVCRVPAGKGKIVITCPKCGAQMQAKT